MSGDTQQVTFSRLPIQSAYIVYGNGPNDPPSALGSVTFDAVLTEEHERTAVVTDHPVEDGVNIVDNVRPLPDRLSLEVFVSNSPIKSKDGVWAPLTLDLPIPGQGGFLAGGTGALLTNLLSGGPPTQATALVTQFAGETDYVRQTYEQLTALRDSAALLTVVCPQATYENMILERIAMHRDKGTGTSGQFQLEFREIRIITSSIVSAPLPSLPSAAPPVSKGKQDAATADADKESLLHHWLN